MHGTRPLLAGGTRRRMEYTVQMDAPRRGKLYSIWRNEWTCSTAISPAGKSRCTRPVVGTGRPGDGPEVRMPLALASASRCTHLRRIPTWQFASSGYRDAIPVVQASITTRFGGGDGVRGGPGRTLRPGRALCEQITFNTAACTPRPLGCMLANPEGRRRVPCSSWEWGELHSRQWAARACISASFFGPPGCHDPSRSSIVDAFVNGPAFVHGSLPASRHRASPGSTAPPNQTSLIPGHTKTHSGPPHLHCSSHARVTHSNADETAAPPTITMRQPPTTPIAIIGMGCRFPGQADTPEKLWEVCAAARNTWSGWPKERLNEQAFAHPQPEHLGSVSRTRTFRPSPSS